MEPIPETVQLARELAAGFTSGGILEALADMSVAVQFLVPSCIGLSVAWLGDDAAFTLVATDEEIARLDAMQYLDGGPCVDAADVGCGVVTSADDLLNEQRWRIFGLATASQGVRSTATFPLVEDGATTGTVNLYAAKDEAFHEHLLELCDILGAWAPGVVMNADLSFTTREVAERAPAFHRARRVVDRAAGQVAVRYGTGVEEARQRIESAATRAGIRAEHLAQALLDLGV